LSELRNKAQVTPYIILGIVILGLVIAYFAINPLKLGKTSETESQFVPVQNYIQDCITSVFNDAVLISSMQAGYITVPNYKYQLNPLLPFSNSLEVSSNMKVPYWFYEDANTVQHLNIPKKAFIENEISNYTKNNMQVCFSNFTSFNGYSIENLDSAKFTTKIEDEQVFLEMQSNIKINYKETEFSFKRYATSIEFPLGSLYDSAVKIMEKENNEFFFEERTIDIMSVYDEIPLTGVTLDCTPKPWIVENVKKSFKDIVNNNLEAVSLQSSNKYYSLDISNANVDSFFSYNQEWPFLLEAEPQKNGLLYPESSISKKLSSSSLTSLVCLNNYNFVYNVKYPVLVRLVKNNHMFQFAFQTIIRSNEPRVSTKAPEVIDTDSQYYICDKRINQQEINVFSSDMSPIDNAEVKYKCITQLCSIGTTNNGTLKEKFPPCLNGLLIVEKENYLPSSIQYSTNQESSVSLFMEPLIEKDLQIVLINKKTGSTKQVSNEKIYLSISDDYGYSEILQYPEQNKIKIAPGTYHLQAQVALNGNFTFKEQKITKCTSVPYPSALGLILKRKECTDVIIDPISLSNIILGGNQFDFTITKENFLGRTLKIYLIIEEKPGNQEELSNIIQSIETNHISDKFKIPEII